MPVPAPTTPTAAVGAFNVTALSSGSFTPGNSALIIAASMTRDATAADTFSAFSASFAHGGWTTIAATNVAYGSAFVRVIIGWCIATSSPGSGTVTATYSTDPDFQRLVLAQIASDFDTASPIAQSANTGSASASSLSGTFAGTPASGSRLVGFAASNPNNTTTDPATGWTELEDLIGNNLPGDSQHVAGSNGTGYGATFGTSQTGGAAASAVEVREPSAAAAVSIAVLLQNYRNMGYMQ